MKKAWRVLIVLILSPFVLCSNGYTADFMLQSPAFAQYAPIPSQYTCDGNNQSPPLIWKNAPENTQSFAIIVDDPDAIGGLWVHWVVFNIPSQVNQLAEAVKFSDGTIEGKNGWGNARYEGPCPPRGTNRYHFRLYALDSQLKLDQTARVGDVNRAMQGHIVGHCELIGMYR